MGGVLISQGISCNLKLWSVGPRPPPPEHRVFRGPPLPPLPPGQQRALGHSCVQNTKSTCARVRWVGRASPVVCHLPLSVPLTFLFQCLWSRGATLSALNLPSQVLTGCFMETSHPAGPGLRGFLQRGMSGVRQESSRQTDRWAPGRLAAVLGSRAKRGGRQARAALLPQSFRSAGSRARRCVGTLAV